MDRRLTREQLQEILAGMKPGTCFTPNKVGNLAVTDPAGAYLGYIDFRTGEVGLFEEAQGG